MRELGYQSGSIDPEEKWPAIEATNCVFHNLAKCYPEVCHFDLAMMSEVVGWDCSSCPRFSVAIERQQTQVSRNTIKRAVIIPSCLSFSDISFMGY